MSLGTTPIDASVSDEPTPVVESGAPDEPAPPDDAPLTLFGDVRTCTGLGCAVTHDCPNGGHTPLSGTVYDPAGQNPLYGVFVFVPDDPAGKLPPITPGTRSCDNTCAAPIAHYVSVAVTDAKGAFTLPDVPTGTSIPLVVQTGKWRRKTLVPSTKNCADTVVPPSLSRLPKNHDDGEMPQMALLTGGCDDLGCFMRSIGIDASEFSRPRGGGRLDVYQGVNAPGGAVSGSAPNLTDGGAGNCTGAGCPLWSTKSDLEYYDLVLLACECDEYMATKPPSAMTALHDWLNEGGKVFATHFHYTWFKNGPSDFQGMATWLGWSAGTGSGTYTLNTSFPKGITYRDWLNNVGAATGSSIALTEVASSVSSVSSNATRWIDDDSTSPPDAKYLSFLTPIGGVSDAGPEGGRDGPPQYCGKAVFTDLHTSRRPSGDVPGACTAGPLTAQQKALEFLFFDLSACVAPNDTQPPPFPPPNSQ